MQKDNIEKIREVEFINHGIEDYKKGRIKEGKSAIKEVREKYGI